MANLPGTLREDMAAQREFLRSRVPSYARLLELLGAELERGLEARLEEAWRERSFGAFYERPLLLLAALRDDALRAGRDHPLWRAIGSPAPDPAALDAERLREALSPERGGLWRTLSRRHLQTNEPSRAVAWLWPAHLSVAVVPGRPAEVFDVGASAGLNLVADLLPPIWERADGGPLQVMPLPRIRRRVGFDLRPLDALDEDDARWLRACVWPGQGGREERLEEAISAFRAQSAGGHAPELRAARAAEVPGLLPRGQDAFLALAYQTVVRDYLPVPEWESYRSGMLDWLGSRPPGTAIWVELEITDAARSGGPPAAISAHLSGADGARSLVLARCEPHPRRLEVDAGAVETLRRELHG